MSSEIKLNSAVHVGKGCGEEDVARGADNIAVRVSNLSKCYQIYDTPRDRLKQFIYPPLQRLAGRPPKRYYREFWALRDVSFEVKRGECIGIIGRNGSGKSTLLQLICGTLTPTYGTVNTTGRVAALLELGAGFNPEFTGRENVYMNASILGLNRKDIDDKYDNILSFADIGDFVDKPVKTYSSGMYVRLAFAIAINVDPEILIIDEALAVGDIRFQVKCFRKLEDLQQQNKTLLFVSHSTNDVVRLCGKAIWLDNGCIRKYGQPKYIVEEYLSWMVHDVGVQQVVNTIPSTESKTANQVNNLIPVPSNAFITGDGGACVVAVGFFTEDNKIIVSLDGRKSVKIVFRVSTKVRIEKPWFAFQIINSKGLRILGSNTCLLEYHLSSIDSGSIIQVSFSFVFPEIENGSYMIAVGVADGTLENHIRHQFVADAYEFKFISSSPLQKQAVLFKLTSCSADVKLL